MFVKTNASKTAGSVACGFGILFVGLIYMSDVITGIIQSSSAVVDIMQSIARSVGITFSAVFAVITGVNIGDYITTYLVNRISARSNPKRAERILARENLPDSMTDRASGKEFLPTAMKELEVAFDAIYEIPDITARLKN